MKQRLSRAYFLQPDVVALARDVLGKVLCVQSAAGQFEAFITETEAYAGVDDRASHAWNGRYTKRTATMYQNGGTIYVYLCYGIHFLCNIVSNREGVPHAILLRGALVREASSTAWKQVSGPGKLTKLLGVNMEFNGEDVTCSPLISLEDRGIRVPSDTIKTTPRIGVDYAGADAALPYRFVWDIPASGFDERVWRPQ
jgi:DNA-3-methyladenine glycosylase